MNTPPHMVGTQNFPNRIRPQPRLAQPALACLASALVTVLALAPTGQAQGTLNASPAATSGLTPWKESRTRVIHSIPGTSTGELFGYRVRNIGDIDGDRLADFAVSAPFHRLNLGRVDAYSSGTGKLVWSHQETTTSAILGFALEPVVDLDGDGVGDVLAAAPFTGPGLVYAYSGRTGFILKTLSGSLTGDSFGFSVATGGDFNGDGTPDIAIGSTGYDIGGRNDGRVYIYSTQGLSLLATIDPPVSTTDFMFGTGLAFVGDLNGDGRDDLAVGVRTRANTTTGSIHVVTSNGQTHTLRMTIPGISFGSGIDADNVGGGGDVDGDGVPDIYAGEGWISQARVFSGATGKQIRRYTETGNDGLGYGGIGIIPDLNADGHADLLIGVRGNARTSPGRVLVYSGRDGRVLQAMTSTVSSTLFGAAADVLGDVDGDRGVDFVVGAMGNQFLNSGQVFVMAGETCFAGRSEYGPGLAGTRGVPGLELDRDPTFVHPTVLTVANSSGTATAGLVLFGTLQIARPTPWGGHLLVDPGFSVGISIPATGLRVPFVAPPGCAQFRIQALQLDPGATMGIAESRGLLITTGY